MLQACLLRASFSLTPCSLVSCSLVSCSLSRSSRPKSTATLSVRARAKESIERTVFAVTDSRRVQGLHVVPQLGETVRDLFKFFPFSPEVVEDILITHPEMLAAGSSRILHTVTMMVELGDFETITQEEALMFVSRCPEILKLDQEKARRRLSEMFCVTSAHNIPWNSVMVASPQSLLLNHRHVSKYLEKLQEYFDPDQLRDVIGNNPNIFLTNWWEVVETMEYLQGVMAVSARRVALTPSSLTLPRDFYYRRYQFLLRCGHYRHPDPGAKARIPCEASPALHLITDTSDQRFVNKCCPGVSVEEWNVFLSTLQPDEGGQGEEVEEDAEEYDDHDEENNHYTVVTKHMVGYRANHEKKKLDKKRLSEENI